MIRPKGFGWTQDPVMVLPPGAIINKHFLHWTLVKLLSRQLGSKQFCVTWEDELKSLWPRILFLGAGMYTTVSRWVPQCLTKEPCRFCVSLPDNTPHLLSGLCLGSPLIKTNIFPYQRSQIFWILWTIRGEKVGFQCYRCCRWGSSELISILKY